MSRAVRKADIALPENLPDQWPPLRAESPARLLHVDFKPQARPGMAETLASSHAAAASAEFGSSIELDPIRQAGERKRSVSRGALSINLVLSLALHASATFLFLEGPETVQIAGGEPVSVVMLGSEAFEDTALTGEESPTEVAPEPIEPEAVQPEEVQPETVQPAPPVPPEPAESTPAEPSETPETIEPEAVAPNGVVVAEPVTPEAAAPEEPATPQTPALPVEPQAPAEEPVEAAEAIEPLPDPIENAPVPTPRPEYTPPPPRQVVREEPRRQPPSGAQGNAQANQQRGSTSGQAAQGASQEGAREAARANAAGNAAVSNYPGQVVTRLRRALRYPAEARRDRLTGEVHVSFTVSASGGVSGVSVVRSSGYPALDQAAIATVQRAAPFPAIPGAAGRSSWPFTVPLAFTR